MWNSMFPKFGIYAHFHILHPGFPKNPWLHRNIVMSAWPSAPQNQIVHKSEIVHLSTKASTNCSWNTVSHGEMEIGKTSFISLGTQKRYVFLRPCHSSVIPDFPLVSAKESHHHRVTWLCSWPLLRWHHPVPRDNQSDCWEGGSKQLEVAGWSRRIGWSRLI